MTSSLKRRIGLGIIVTLALCSGLWLREWIYPASEAYRFRWDMNNAWKQGMIILDAARARPDTSKTSPTLGQVYRSYLTRYDAAIAASADGRYQLDYPPGRLLLIAVWVWASSIAEQVPPESIDTVIWPLLMLNTAFELLGCFAAYSLVRVVLRRQGDPNADLFALFPAVLMWFNPPAILDAHVWPQWDVWLVPFYLFAACFGVTRKWILSGILLGAGALLKGQMLLTLPAFLLWPLFQARWRAVLEVASGVLLAVMAYASPWMLRTEGAWVALFAILAIAGVALRWVPRSARPLFICGVLGGSLLFAGLAFDGSFGWYRVGFEYGTKNYQALFMGPTLNAAALLDSKLGWKLDTLVGWPAGLSVSVRTALILVYGASLLLCSFGLARHDLRNDRRILIAFAAPWVLMFAFLAQMHDRYLVWGALLTAVGAGVSPAATLLHIVASFLAFLPIGYHLLAFNRQFDHPLMPVFQATWPDASWATILLAFLLLYLALKPSRSRLRANDNPDPAILRPARTLRQGSGRGKPSPNEPF